MVLQLCYLLGRGTKKLFGRRLTSQLAVFMTCEQCGAPDGSQSLCPQPKVLVQGLGLDVTCREKHSL